MWYNTMEFSLNSADGPGAILKALQFTNPGLTANLGRWRNEETEVE